MRKKWIIILTTIFVLVAGVFFYIKFRGSKDFEPVIKEKLQQIVKEASDSLYILDVDKINVDVVNSQVIVINASLNIDTIRLAQLDKLQQAPNDVYKISLKNLLIDGINVDDFLKKNSFDLKTL